MGQQHRSVWTACVRKAVDVILIRPPQFLPSGPSLVTSQPQFLRFPVPCRSLFSHWNFEIAFFCSVKISDISSIDWATWGPNRLGNKKVIRSEKCLAFGLKNSLYIIWRHTTYEKTKIIHPKWHFTIRKHVKMAFCFWVLFFVAGGKESVVSWTGSRISSGRSPPIQLHRINQSINSSNES